MIRNYLFVFLAVTVTLVQSATVSVQDKVPRITGYIVKDDTIDVKWSKVENDMCPITGYKLKVYRLQGPTVYEFQTVDGKEVLVSTQKPISIDDNGTRILFQDIDVKGADNTNAMFGCVSGNVVYETQVLAYCAGAEGPLSGPEDRIRINGIVTKCG